MDLQKSEKRLSVLMQVEIRRPTFEDIPELKRFFRTVINDTFEKEGIGEMVEDMNEEIKAKDDYLESDLESDGENRYFLIASVDGRIIGSIEYGQASELIIKCTNNALKGTAEVGTIFVHPDYQGKGIGNRLLHSMYMLLHRKGIAEFCLDSGYRMAQQIWKKKFGEPDYLLFDYWGKDQHHMIWRIKVADCLKNAIG